MPRESVIIGGAYGVEQQTMTLPSLHLQGQLSAMMTFRHPKEDLDLLAINSGRGAD